MTCGQETCDAFNSTHATRQQQLKPAKSDVLDLGIADGHGVMKQRLRTNSANFPDVMAPVLLVPGVL